MKRKILNLLVMISLLLALPMTAQARTYNGEDDWGVKFTQDEKMVSTFKTSELTDLARGLQPGDDMVVTLTLKNEHKTTTDWYMLNKVIESLEDSAEAAKKAVGAYTYK